MISREFNKCLKAKLINNELFFKLLYTLLPGQCELTGATNLMQHHGLEHSYNKMTVKKVKEPLGAFLPHLPGNIDTPGHHDNRYVIISVFPPKLINKWQV